jgi:hypothetical protein
MPSYHNNKLTMVGLDSDSDEKSYTPTKTSRTKRKRGLEHKTHVNQEHKHCDSNVEIEPYTAPPSALYNGKGEINGYEDDASSFAYWSVNPFGGLHDPSSEQSNLNNYSPMYDVFIDTASSQNPFSQQEHSIYASYKNLNGSSTNTNDTNGATIGEALLQESATSNMTTYASRGDEGIDGDDDTTPVKQEAYTESAVSSTPLGGSECYESEYDEHRPCKIPKLNKDGIPRKPRQPRPKLLKWDDNDWKNVALGLVWACGENGIQIPFDQASQIVSESCTAGALQQALLKLRGKQIAEGFQIPSLRMAWTRKNKNAVSSSSSANSKTQQVSIGTHKRKPTRFAGNQSLLVTLRRAYMDAERSHLRVPYTMATSASLTVPSAPAIAATQAPSTPMHSIQAPSYMPMTPVSPFHDMQPMLSTPFVSPFQFAPQPILPSSSPTYATISHRRDRHNILSTPTRRSDYYKDTRFTTLVDNNIDLYSDSPTSAPKADARRPSAVRFAPPPDCMGESLMPDCRSDEHHDSTDALGDMDETASTTFSNGRRKLFTPEDSMSYTDMNPNFNGKLEDNDGLEGGLYFSTMGDFLGQPFGSNAANI